jgi:hypothetical protein
MCVKLGLSLKRKVHVKKMLENKSILRRIFGPKRKEVIGGWRKLHNDKLINCIFTEYYEHYGERIKEDEVDATDKF